MDLTDRRMNYSLCNLFLCLKMHSSEEEFESSEKDEVDEGGDGPGLMGLATLRTPSHVLSGHSSVVISADWLPGTTKIKEFTIMRRAYSPYFILP